MHKRAVVTIKVLLHLALLAPLIYLLHLFRDGALALEADPVNHITHFTGDWALWILLASLAITPVRRLTPRLSALIRFRRMIGLYAFLYASLHLATYVFLFSGFDLPAVLSGIEGGRVHVLEDQWRAVWPTILGDVEKRRFIQVGFAAWLILLALAVTSPTVMLRSMGGKAWQRLHRLVYVAAVAACIHYWWLVKTGVLRPWRDTAVLAVLLAARLVYGAIKRSSKKPAGSIPPVTAV